MGTLCYAKNRCCESSRGTSPLSWKGTSVRLIKVPFPRRRMCPKNWRPMNRGSIVVFNILSIIKAGGFVSKRSTQAHNANWPITPPPPLPQWMLWVPSLSFASLEKPCLFKESLLCSYTFVWLLTQVTSILGPLPRNPFQSGKFFPDLSEFVAQTPGKFHITQKCARRNENIIKKVWFCSETPHNWLAFDGPRI